MLMTKELFHSPCLKHFSNQNRHPEGHELRILNVPFTGEKKKKNEHHQQHKKGYLFNF